MKSLKLLALDPRLAERIACLSGLLGAWLIALPAGSELAKYGWLLYLISNIGWLTFAVYHKHRWLFLQTLGFLGSTSLGIINHF